MSDAWMDEYTYQIVVHKDLLTDEQKKREQAPTVLAPWDPMGALAKQKGSPPSWRGLLTLGGELHGFRPMLYNHCLLNEQSVGVFR